MVRLHCSSISHCLFAQTTINTLVFVSLIPLIVTQSSPKRTASVNAEVVCRLTYTWVPSFYFQNTAYNRKRGSPGFHFEGVWCSRSLRKLNVKLRPSQILNDDELRRSLELHWPYLKPEYNSLINWFANVWYKQGQYFVNAFQEAYPEKNAQKGFFYYIASTTRDVKLNASLSRFLDSEPSNSKLVALKIINDEVHRVPFLSDREVEFSCKIVTDEQSTGIIKAGSQFLYQIYVNVSPGGRAVSFGSAGKNNCTSKKIWLFESNPHFIARRSVERDTESEEMKWDGKLFYVNDEADFGEDNIEIANNFELNDLTDLRKRYDKFVLGFEEADDDSECLSSLNSIADWIENMLPRRPQESYAMGEKKRSKLTSMITNLKSQLDSLKHSVKAIKQRRAENEFYRMVYTWVPAFTFLNRMSDRRAKPEFVLHGFWEPSKLPLFIGDPFDRFILMEDQTLFRRLRNWPYLNPDIPNRMSWYYHQWNKHGQHISHYIPSLIQNRFFSKVMDIHEYLALNSALQYTNLPNILSNNEPLDVEDIRQALSAVSLLSAHDVELQCLAVDDATGNIRSGEQYLYQIAINFKFLDNEFVVVSPNDNEMNTCTNTHAWLFQSNPLNPDGFAVAVAEETEESQSEELVFLIDDDDKAEVAVNEKDVGSANWMLVQARINKLRTDYERLAITEAEKLSKVKASRSFNRLLNRFILHQESKSLTENEKRYFDERCDAFEKLLQTVREEIRLDALKIKEQQAQEALMARRKEEEAEKKLAKVKLLPQLDFMMWKLKNELKLTKVLVNSFELHCFPLRYGNEDALRDAKEERNDFQTFVNKFQKFEQQSALNLNQKDIEYVRNLINEMERNLEIIRNTRKTFSDILMRLSIVPREGVDVSVKTMDLLFHRHMLLAKIDYIKKIIARILEHVNEDILSSTEAREFGEEFRTVQSVELTTVLNDAIRVAQLEEKVAEFRAAKTNVIRIEEQLRQTASRLQVLIPRSVVVADDQRQLLSFIEQLKKRCLKHKEEYEQIINEFVNNYNDYLQPFTEYEPIRAGLFYRCMWAYIGFLRQEQITKLTEIVDKLNTAAMEDAASGMDEIVSNLEAMVRSDHRCDILKIAEQQVAKNAKDLSEDAGIISQIMDDSRDRLTTAYFVNEHDSTSRDVAAYLTDHQAKKTEFDRLLASSKQDIKRMEIFVNLVSSKPAKWKQFVAQFHVAFSAAQAALRRVGLELKSIKKLSELEARKKRREDKRQKSQTKR